MKSSSNEHDYSYAHSLPLFTPYPTIEYDLPLPVCPYANSEQL